ncbi:unnamed protein product, partial [Adineta steineri]
KQHPLHQQPLPHRQHQPPKQRLLHQQLLPPPLQRQKQHRTRLPHQLQQQQKQRRLHQQPLPHRLQRPQLAPVHQRALHQQQHLRPARLVLQLQLRLQHRLRL